MNKLAEFWQALCDQHAGHRKLFLLLLILCGFSGSALAQSAGAPLPQCDASEEAFYLLRYTEPNTANPGRSVLALDKVSLSGPTPVETSLWQDVSPTTVAAGMGNDGYVYGVRAAAADTFDMPTVGGSHDYSNDHRAFHVLRVGMDGVEDIGEIGDGPFAPGTARLFDPQSLSNFNAAAIDPATGHLLAGIVRPGVYGGVYDRLETLLRVDISQSPPQLVDIISLTSALPGNSSGDFTVDQRGQYAYGIAYNSGTGSTWWRIELATGDVTTVSLGTTHPSYGAAATLPSGNFAFFSNSGALAIFDATGALLRTDNTATAESADAARCLLPHSSIVYVDDNFAGNSFYDTVSFVGNPEPTCAANTGGVYGVDAFATITEALANVQSGGTVCVAAGTYAETDGGGNNLIIDKPVSIYGAQAGADARNRTDSGASIIIPAVGAPGLDYQSSAGRIVIITSDDVVLDGFVLDGDNSTITTGLQMGSADPDVAIGVTATGSHIEIRNNVVRNLLYAGIFGLNNPPTLPAGTGNVISTNWIYNIDAPSDFGIGIAVGYNYYADVSANLLEDVRIGIQTNYYNKPAPTGTDAFIQNNEIYASRLGVYFHYFTATSSPFTVRGNQISANFNTAQDGMWIGMLVSNFLSDSLGYVQDNHIDGIALAGSGRLRAGYQTVLISTVHAPDMTIDGGTVSNVDDGVMATDGAFFSGPMNNITVQNVAFSNVARAAFHVEDTLMVGTETTDNAPKITVGADNTFFDVTYQGALTGPLATIAYTSGAVMLDSLLVRAAGLGHRGGLADSKGNVREAANALINSGIEAVATSGTVTVESGTFVENVPVNKAVTVLGPKAGIAGYDAARDGTGEAVLTGTMAIGAPDVTVDGFSFADSNALVLVKSVGTNNARFAFINNAVSGTNPSVEGVGTLSTLDWQVSHNLFVDTHYGVRMNGGAQSGMMITNNAFHGVGAPVQMIATDNARIAENVIDGLVPEGTYTGIQVANSSNTIVSGNQIRHARNGIMVDHQNDAVVMSCNDIEGDVYGIVAPPYYPLGVESMAIFHNRVVAPTHVSSAWAANEVLTIGANYYDGAPIVLDPRNGTQIDVADALASNPIGNAACGDNTATTRVVLSGTPQSTMAGTAFPTPLKLRFTDALGGAAVGEVVSFAAPANGASAVLSASSLLTDYNGSVEVTATANNHAGNYLVEASTSGASPAFFDLTNTKSTGTVDFAPLTAPYGTLHTVTATMSPADTNVTCTAVSGVPAQSAAPGNYLVSASCEGDNTVATGTATYVVTASTAAIESVPGSAPVGVVTVDPQPDADAKKSYFSWVTNGSAAENVVAEFVIGTGNASPHAGDLTLEYLEIMDNSWQPLPLSFDAGTGTWAGVFGTPSGFPLIDGTQSQFRATFQRGGRYMTTANLVGASSGLTLATSHSLATDVADIDLVGSGNAAGVVGVAVDTGYSLVNSGTAALSSGGAGNPIPAQQAPNDENVRGRFFIEWDGGALTPADPNGVGGNGSNCGAETCASPDVAVEFFDAASSSYRPIHNLRAELDGSNQSTGRLYGYFGATTSGGVPVPAGYSGTYLFRTTSKTHTGNYTVISQVVGVDTSTVYAQAADQTIAVGSGNAASIEIVGDDFDASIVGGIAYNINGDGNFRVLVRDSGGNPVDGASVAFNAPASGASAVLSAGSCTTDIAGECHVTAVTNDVAGSFVVEVSIANGQFVEFDLTNFADIDPSQVQIATVSGDGQTAQVGNAYGLPLVAKVTDRFGNPLEGVAVEFNAPATGASVTPAAVSGLTDADGLVDSGTLTANATAGGFSVSASVDALACASASCNVGYALINTAAGVANVTLVSSAASAAVGTLGAYTLTASVTDDDSNPVPGVSVTLIGPSAGAGVMPAVHAGISDSAGQVMHVFDANTIAGAFQVQAVVSGVNSTDVTLTNLAGAAAKIVYVAGDGQSAAVGAPFATDLTVRVVDQYDNAVDDAAAASVSFTAPGTGASATVTPSANSGTNGLASTPAVANSEVGNYSVTASFNGHDVGFALTNTVGALSISDIVWVDNSTASIAFDGNAKAATATVTGSSLIPSFTYNGSAAAPTNAGSYQVIATIDDGNVYGTATAMLTITPAGAGNSGITLTGGSYTYDGSNKPATVVNPNGVAYALSYSTGNGLPPVDVGSYIVSLTVNDPNHAADTLTATIDITPANVEVSFGNLSHVYDGTVKAATVTTTPAGVSGVSLAYDNSPVDAGSYTVTASLSNPNFVLIGSTDATLVIAKASAQIFLSDLNHVYDGSAKAATVSTVPAALAANVVVTYNPANPLNVGSYAVEASLVGQTNYADTTVTGTLTIVAATVAGFEIDGGDTFTGIAGEALTAPLPTVRVFDTADNGVSGISVSFQVTAGGGSILAGGTATVTTDSAGLAVVPEWVLGAVAGNNTMTASTGMTGLATLSFNATGIQVADLTISKEVDLAQAHAGQVLTWTIEVSNAGPSTAEAELLDAIPSGVDTVSWTCVAEDGASCGVASGTGDIQFTSTIPAGGRIIVVISATVTAAAPTGQPLVNEAAVNWQSEGNAESATDSASVGIVPAESGPCSIFCDGFEEAGRSVALVMPGNGDMGAKRVGGWQLQPLASGKPVAALELLDSTGTAVAWVDVITAGKSQLLRLRQLDAKGVERASAWVSLSHRDVLGYQWDQGMDGLVLQFVAVGKAGKVLELQLPPGAPIPQRVRLLAAALR